MRMMLWRPQIRHRWNRTHLSPRINTCNPAEKQCDYVAFLKRARRLTNIMRSTTQKCAQQSHYDRWSLSFPVQQFQARLTLFPKSFSSFPQGTCLLSASSLYLALDEIYHPLYGPIPRIVTLRTHAVHRGLQQNARFSPTTMPFSKGLSVAPPLAFCLAATI